MSCSKKKAPTTILNRKRWKRCIANNLIVKLRKFQQRKITLSCQAFVNFILERPLFLLERLLALLERPLS